MNNKNFFDAINRLTPLILLYLLLIYWISFSFIFSVSIMIW